MHWRWKKACLSHGPYGVAPAPHQRHWRCRLYLMDRFADGGFIYDIDFDFIEGAQRYPTGQGLKIIDHLTHNVYRGRMAY
jgi:4-hydroxyphenylpyruvate dioxygenase-like putative hemolysin